MVQRRHLLIILEHSEVGIRLVQLPGLYEVQYMYKYCKRLFEHYSVLQYPILLYCSTAATPVLLGVHLSVPRISR